MSYDIRAAWPEPEVSISEWANSDVEDGKDPQGLADLLGKREELVQNLTRGDSNWESHRSEDGDVELTHTTSTVQLLITSHEVEGGITYGGSKFQFEFLWQCVTRLREAGATVWDPQQCREIRDTDTLDAAWTAYAQANAAIKFPPERIHPESPPPRTFNRIQYLLLILLLIGALIGSIWAWSGLGLEAHLPYFPLGVCAVVFLIKMFALDPPRLRSIGMNEGLIFFNLLPPLMLLIQIKLFCYPPKQPVVPIRAS